MDENPYRSPESSSNRPLRTRFWLYVFVLVSLPIIFGGWVGVILVLAGIEGRSLRLGGWGALLAIAGNGYLATLIALNYLRVDLRRRF